MTKEKMTISKLIAEIKLTETKIQKLVLAGLPVVQKRADNLLTPKKKSEEEFTDVAKKYSASLQGLMKRKFALKAALIKTNAEKTFKFMDTTLTIAEAITKKEYLGKELGVYRTLYATYVRQENIVTKANEALEVEVQRHLEHVYGSDTTKKNSPDAESVAKEYRKARGVELFDPCNFEKVLPEKIEEIEEFFAGIDNRLSEINALTEVELEY